MTSFFSDIRRRENLTITWKIEREWRKKIRGSESIFEISDFTYCIYCLFEGYRGLWLNDFFEHHFPFPNMFWAIQESPSLTSLIENLQIDILCLRQRWLDRPFTIKVRSNLSLDFENDSRFLSMKLIYSYQYLWLIHCLTDQSVLQ